MHSEIQNKSFEITYRFFFKKEGYNLKKFFLIEW